ncbi:MAG: hypothetical protein EXR93_08975 [Gemmatimonadetes bacterium]|nr:hypothetical protein [Gemmatimonadota bacterium]
MAHPAEDSTFTALKERGGKAMRVDQDASAHVFDALPDGGRIELQATDDDRAAIDGIREHFKEIETAFRKGDFAIPMFVHDGEVPGTAVMAAGRNKIVYVRRDLPRGAELLLQTSDSEVVNAIRGFMNFQRSEHRAGGQP